MRSETGIKVVEQRCEQAGDLPALLINCTTSLDLLKPATQSASTTLLATLPCHLALRTVFQAQELSVKQITDVLTEATKKDPDLLETILDVTEIIEQELEDTKDLVQGNEATTDSVPRSPSKALQVVKALLVNYQSRHSRGD